MAFFSSGRGARAGDGPWPKGPVLDYLRRRFNSVEHLQDDKGYSFYGVTDNGVRFVVAFLIVDGAPDMVAEVGFLVRFAGYPATQATIESINRNLHISVATLDADGDVYLIGGVRAAGQYDDAAFGLICDAWRRDMMMTIEGVTGGSLVSAFPAARNAAARRFAENRAPQAVEPKKSSDRSPGGPEFADVLTAFMGTKSGATMVCPTCGGRGKIGLIARPCETCGGSGFVRAARR